MELKVLSNEEYDMLISKLDQVLEILVEKSKKAKGPLTDVWLDTSEVARILKISTRTLQNYRDMRVIPFSQIGHKIYFKASDIEKYLNMNYIGVKNF